MRNVLELIDSFDQGGSEHQAVQLTRALHANGNFNVRVACLKSGGVLQSSLEEIGFHQIPEFPLNSFYDFTAAKQLLRFTTFLKERQIDVVHTHDFYTNLFGMAGATLAGIPVRIASRRESGKRHSQKRLVERGAYRLAKAVIANCDAVRQQLLEEGVRAEKVMTIYNGVGLSSFCEPSHSRNDTLEKFGLPTDRHLRFVAIVANLRPVKDYPTFLRAAAEVAGAIPDSAFLIAGEGDLLTSLQSLAADLGLNGKVFFLGRCESVTELLALSEVCALSSESEGFSNSILEYMAAGRPVVVTDVGGAREAVADGENGYLVPSGDYKKMAACIISLLAEPERARAFGECGRETAKERFSSEKQLCKIEALYEKLLLSAKPYSSDSEYETRD